MKLEDQKTDTTDLMQLLEESYEKELQFWQEVENYVIHGVPAADEKGHWAEIRIRVRPSQMDLVTALREKSPPGMFKSQADLIRSLIATGCKTHLEFFKRRKSARWRELEEILTGLNVLGRKHRLQELKTDVQKAMRLTVNGAGSPEEKAAVVELLASLERKVTCL